MNFDFLKPIDSLKQFYDICVNAEILALDFPIQSVITSRKAMEYIVKLLYSASIDEDIRGKKISALLDDKRFVNYMDDKSMMDAFHFIRVKGNIAAHQNVGINITDSINVLKSLQYVAGETAISLGFISEYPLFNEKALLHTRSVHLKTKPIENVAKCISLMLDVDSRLFDRLNDEEKENLKAEIDELEKIVRTVKNSF